MFKGCECLANYSAEYKCYLSLSRVNLYDILKTKPFYADFSLLVFPQVTRTVL